ncbi:MAG: hypothetical protein ACK4IZ_01970 [Flavobacterium sp.]|uniref:hypothetical protein n=1 Tax=Flavobacterium sp. TaxID=239 RepID=UPI00391BA3C2
MSVVLTLNSTNTASKYFKTLLSDDVLKSDASINNQIASSQTTMSGTWYWKSASNDSETEFYLIQNGNEVTGKHCSSFIGGTKLDCIENNAEDSIVLSLVSENVYEGTIRSGFSEAVINIRLTLNPNNNTLFLKQLSQPSEEYYLPNNVFMTLAQP